MMSAITKYFHVAGHRFALSGAASDLPAEGLDNYKPFEVEADGIPPLFTLRLEAFEVPEEKQPLLVQESEDDMPVLNLYACPDGRWFLEMSPHRTVPVCAHLLFDPEQGDAQLHVLTRRLTTFAVNDALMLLFARRTAGDLTLEMHASVVEKDGRGVLFLGKSGAGKSTHSSLWLKYIEGTSLLNDDNPILRAGEDGVRVYGSPWSGKTPCYRNHDVPVAAIVRIRQAPFNKIHRLSVLEAYASVYSSCSAFRADRAWADGIHAATERIAATVPCYTLDCLPDEGAARLSYGTVYGKESPAE